MGKHFVKIRCTSDAQWRELQQQAALDLFPHTAKRLPDSALVIDGLLTHQQITQLRAHHYVVDIVAEAQSIAHERQPEIGHDSIVEATNEHPK